MCCCRVNKNKSVEKVVRERKNKRRRAEETGTGNDVGKKGKSK